MDDTHRRFLDSTLPHLDIIYRVARHSGAAHWQAEDLVQETYLHAFRAFESHKGPSTRAWLVAICLNLARSEGRRRSHRVVEQPFEGFSEPIQHGSDVFDEVAQGFQREAIAGALRRLPDDQRIAIVLMDLAGHSAAEVALLLSCPRGTVLARVHRGRRRLATLLAEEGAEHGLL